MRVTIHESRVVDRSLDPRQEGTRSNVYALKIEFGGTDQGPHDEKVEIACGGMFYRLEPDEDGLSISLVGVSVKRLVVLPKSANTITVKGVQQLGE